MSLLVIQDFFPSKGTSQGCNKVVGAPNLDAVLAAFATLFMYLLIIPVWYTIARIISPQKAKFVEVIKSKEEASTEKSNLKKPTRFSEFRSSQKLFENIDEETTRHRLMYYYKFISRFTAIDLNILTLLNIWLSRFKTSFMKQEGVKEVVEKYPKIISDLEKKRLEEPTDDVFLTEITTSK
jgi:hypothetical protein